MRIPCSFLPLLLGALVTVSDGFVTSVETLKSKVSEQKQQRQQQQQHWHKSNVAYSGSQLSASITTRQLLDETRENDLREQSFVLSEEQVKPIVTFHKGTEKEKIVNVFGVWCFIVTLLTCPVWVVAMSVVNFVDNLMDEKLDPNRDLYDKTGKLWSKVMLTMMNSYPTFSGNLDCINEYGCDGEQQQACLYVANHASWLDIPVVCTILDPVFKFIAKGELRTVPCIGQQLVGGRHILIDREDRRSQLKTFKDGINWLKRGVSIMAFPEGRRSKDGRLMEFKGGIFSMALKTGVPIVPITISHVHAVMPSNSLFPVQPGASKLHVHVHDPIVTTDGKTEAELSDLVRKAFLSSLPYSQHPLKGDIATGANDSSRNGKAQNDKDTNVAQKTVSIKVDRDQLYHRRHQQLNGHQQQATMNHEVVHTSHQPLQHRHHQQQTHHHEAPVVSSHDVHHVNNLHESHHHVQQHAGLHDQQLHTLGVTIPSEHLFFAKIKTTNDDVLKKV